MARVLFEKNDIPGACAANANALAQATQDEVELQNQIQYQGQRCASYTASRSATAAADTSSAIKPPTLPAAKTTPQPIAASSTPSVPQPLARPIERATADSGIVERTATGSAPQSVARPKPPVEARDAKPSIVDKPKIAPESPKTKPSTPTHTAAAYSVQVAAYPRRAEAEKLVVSLGKRGYAARVDGDVAPFRVRIGRYPSAKEAETALARIKAKHMEGFVVRAPER
jgi:cell division septation protein DedD